MPGPMSALSSIACGGLVLDNRIAFAATVNNLGRNRQVTAEQVAFYAARAAGGTGLVVTEGLSVHPTSHPNDTTPMAYEPAMVPELRKIANAVHGHDRHVFGQLWHVGRQALWNPTMQPWAVSARRDPYSGTTPHVMTSAEIEQVVAGFVDSARNLRAAGFDGVELHGAHGYLITQFLSPSSNTRADVWGGSVANRSRFVVDVVRGIQAACGADFPVALKITAHEYVDAGLDLELSQETVDHLLSEVDLGYVAVSQANFSPSLEYHVPDQRFPDVPFEHLARGIHDAVAGRTPTMAVAKIPDVATASRLVDEGTADLIGMSRALLADPALVSKARTGQSARPCIYCNVCWERIHTGRAVHCIYAPDTGREASAPGRRAAGSNRSSVQDLPLSVRVHGAGPAGLEFARVAAERGHSVELRERTSEAGGRLRGMAGVPGLESYGLAADWMTQAALDAGVTLVLDAGEMSEAARSTPVDVDVVAVGAHPHVEELAGVPSLSLADALDKAQSLADPVVVVDEIEAEPVYAAVEALAAQGREVRIVTRQHSIGRRVAYISQIGLFRRLDEAGVTIHPLLAPVRVDDGELVVRHVFSRRESSLGPVGTVVRAGPFEANRADPSELSSGSGDDEATRRVVIGDASSPREILAAVMEANDRASELPFVAATGGESSP